MTCCLQVYFWVSVVTFVDAKLKLADTASFTVMRQQPSAQCLSNPCYINKFYSHKLLASDAARREFVPPVMCSDVCETVF